MVRSELLFLLGFVMAPLIIDVVLVLFAIRWAGRRVMLGLIALMYLVFNVALPLGVVFAFFTQERLWLLVIFGIVKVLEFGAFSIHKTYRDLWILPVK